MLTDKEIYDFLNKNYSFPIGKDHKETLRLALVSAFRLGHEYGWTLDRDNDVSPKKKVTYG